MYFIVCMMTSFGRSSANSCGRTILSNSRSAAVWRVWFSSPICMLSARIGLSAMPPFFASISRMGGKSSSRIWRRFSAMSLL